MSGGSHNYLYAQIEGEYVGKMYDRELDNMMHDVAVLLHDLEWYDSGDTCEDTYKASVQRFKAKWLAKTPAAIYSRRMEAVDDLVDNIHDTISKLVLVASEDDATEGAIG